MRLEPFTGNYLTDPGRTWQELLDGPPVCYAEDLGMWLIIRHEHVQRALGDNRRFLNALTLAPVYEVCPEALNIIMQIDAPPTTVAADVPVHTRTRRALRASFANTTARVDEQYGPIVRGRVDELMRQVKARAGRGELDLITEFTTALPLLVLVDILGVPARDIPRIRQWADGQIALVWGNPEPPEQVRLAQGLLDFWRYCQQLVAGLLARGEYGDDFVGRVLRFRNDDDTVLTGSEAASLAFNLLVAGHETTAGLLAHSLDLALSVPQRWDELVEDPDRVPAFVEEALRLRPAIDGWLRITAEPVELGGVTIPGGARCLLVIGAANRDPAVFHRAGEFDPGRANLRDQLSLGFGPHYCVGAALVRLEAEVALRRLVADLPGLRLAEGYQRSYKPNVGFRAHHTLPATLPGARNEFDGVLNEVAGRAEPAGLLNDVAGARNDLSGGRNDLSGVRNEVAGVRNEVAGVRNEVGGGRNEPTGAGPEVAGVTDAAVPL
jgi:cytochrome P450